MSLFLESKISAHERRKSMLYKDIGICCIFVVFLNDLFKRKVVALRHQLILNNMLGQDGRMAKVGIYEVTQIIRRLDPYV